MTGFGSPLFILGIWSAPPPAGARSPIVGLFAQAPACAPMLGHAGSVYAVSPLTGTGWAVPMVANVVNGYFGQSTAQAVLWGIRGTRYGGDV